MATLANVLDPIQDHLTEYLWIDAASPQPKLRPRLREWMEITIRGQLDNYHPESISWSHLCLTGSLVGYQFSNASDCDISVFPSPNFLPEWDRSALIAKVIHSLDNLTVPGTPYKLQTYIVSPKITKEMLYQPNLRAGYDLDTDQWIVPPDPHMAHDIQKEYNSLYIRGMEVLDKMRQLIKYNPKRAPEYLEHIHQKRRAEEARGHGDFGPWNISWKMLDRAGMINEALTNEHSSAMIAQASSIWEWE